MGVGGGWRCGIRRGELGLAGPCGEGIGWGQSPGRRGMGGVKHKVGRSRWGQSPGRRGMGGVNLQEGGEWVGSNTR